MKLWEIRQIKDKTVQKVRLLKLLEEYEPNSACDISYFAKLEFEFDEKTTDQINAAKDIFVSKVNLAKKTEQHKV